MTRPTFSLTTAMIWGIEAQPVQVEVSISGGLPGIAIVGRPDASVVESRSRVRCAMRAAGFTVPRESVTVNLSPSEVHKTGTAFDLPIAVAILAATGQVPLEGLDRSLIVGELSLSGEVRPVRGALAYADLASRLGLRLIGPRAHLTRRGGVSLEGRFVETLAQLKAGVERAGAPLGEDGAPREPPTEPDFSDVAGQEVAKRALVVAAAGGLGALMIGPPGVGKTMLARCMPSILPPMDEQETFETVLIQSVASVSDARVEAGLRPFRAPHHSASSAGLIGGGRPVTPGEISLAHNGVLFLDELGEFPRSTLQMLRQPMEERCVRVTRVEGTYEFPCRFQLIAASNPCPCGHLGDKLASCTCSPTAIASYRSKLTGPLADRIDLICQLERPTIDEMMGRGAGTGSDKMRDQVCAARELAGWRQAHMGEANSAGERDERAHIARSVAQARMAPDARRALEQAAGASALSARGITSAIRVARAVADVEQSEEVLADHLLEALAYRDRSVVA